MTTSMADRQSARPFRKLGAAGWLALAASPVFAAMAWAAAADPGPALLCAAGRLPIHGMPAMYLLMSLFHLPSWLRLRAPSVRA